MLLFELWRRWLLEWENLDFLPIILFRYVFIVRRWISCCTISPDLILGEVYGVPT
jgi:hypothetical protein